MTEKRSCLECNEEFSGRTDKKFCSDMCRNAFNNRLNSDSGSQLSVISLSVHQLVLKHLGEKKLFSS